MFFAVSKSPISRAVLRMSMLIPPLNAGLEIRREPGENSHLIRAVLKGVAEDCAVHAVKLAVKIPDAVIHYGVAEIEIGHYYSLSLMRSIS